MGYINSITSYTLSKANTLLLPHRVRKEKYRDLRGLFHMIFLGIAVQVAWTRFSKRSSDKGTVVLGPKIEWIDRSTLEETCTQPIIVECLSRPECCPDEAEAMLKKGYNFVDLYSRPCSPTS